MKLLLATFALLCSGYVDAAEKAAPIPPHSTSAALYGEVLEVKDVAGYTYLRLKGDGAETWAAVPTTAVKKGTHVSIDNGAIMNNFKSKSLHRTFATIVFGTIGNVAADAAAAPSPASASRGALAVPDASGIKVSKAVGANARTVAEVLASGPELKDKTVLVQGKIVKYTPDVMGKNWIHLRDGSGAAADKTNDIVVTSTDRAKTGDIVTVSGIVHTDKNLGSGYFFKTLIEEATLRQ